MNKKVIFMGTPQIAVPSLLALHKSGFDIPLVISQPDRPKGRGNQVLFTPVKEAAAALGIDVYQPEKIKSNQEAYDRIKSFNPDFFAVVAYGKILPDSILNIPIKASVNVHFSLLPLYRGAAPVNWAIVNGDEYTGVSTMKMDSGMDTGDILLVEKTPVLRKNAVDIAAELSEKGADLLVRTLKEYDSITPVKQPENGSYAPMMSKEDGLIKWDSLSAFHIERMIRGFVPWPAVYTSIDGKILKIFDADVDNSLSGKPGEIVDIGKDFITVAAKDFSLKIKEVQLEGKKRMSVKDFLAGYKLMKGSVLGTR